LPYDIIYQRKKSERYIEMDLDNTGWIENDLKFFVYKLTRDNPPQLLEPSASFFLVEDKDKAILPRVLSEQLTDVVAILNWKGINLAPQQTSGAAVSEVAPNQGFVLKLVPEVVVCERGHVKEIPVWAIYSSGHIKDADTFSNLQLVALGLLQPQIKSRGYIYFYTTVEVDL
jgi:hypothetical protein